MDLREASPDIVPSEHWYYRTKSLPLYRYFMSVTDQEPNRVGIVDVGAGSGVFSEGLLDRFPNRIRNVIRVDRHYSLETRHSDTRLQGGTVEHRRGVPARIESAVVLLMDVVEHVPDDIAFLRSVTESCVGLNHVFVTAPAFKALWSQHDQFLGHYRRYSLSALEKVCARAGITVSAGYYLFGTIFPLVWLHRRLWPRAESKSDLQPVHAPVNRLLTAAGRWEVRWCRMNRLAGVTAVVEGTIGA